MSENTHAPATDTESAPLRRRDYRSPSVIAGGVIVALILYVVSIGPVGWYREAVIETMLDGNAKPSFRLVALGKTGVDDLNIIYAPVLLLLPIGGIAHSHPVQWYFFYWQIEMP
ncbi:hypothetical protein DB346_12980 [Verrucomicrobia bacterium LW23]|nr:hypothetical protein DB346_12980 [Verrucomicrobia bacterium LW23]